MELKPCPFCGSDSVEIGHNYPQQFGVELYFFVVCDYCGCRTANYRNVYVAADTWNRRADNAAD